jgi:competence protein ComEC
MQSFAAEGHPIDLVLDNGQQRNTATYQEYKALADEIGVELAERGEVYQLDTMTEMTVLSPVQPLLFSDYNGNSIVVMIRFNAVSFLLVGDLEGPGESNILGSGLEVNATILKVGHHGSDSSTTEPFLSAVRPEVAVISVGANNTYGHPSQEVLDRLPTHEVDVYRTDLNGNVTVTTDGMNYSISAEATPQENEPLIQRSTPIKINEVELNPEGQDSGNEWIELFNPSDQTVDISGWTVKSTHGDTNTYTLPQGTTLSPNQHWVINFTDQFLDNTNESAVLYDDLGNEVDRTPLLSDPNNNYTTWQRETDGSERWMLKPETKDTSN